MRRYLSINVRLFLTIFIAFVVSQSAFAVSSFDNVERLSGSASVDRIALVEEQLGLLKNRITQTTNEQRALQLQHDQELSQPLDVTQMALDKASMDVAVSNSNIDSLNIELTDSQTNINSLQKNIQEVKNQLNLLAVFGLKMSPGGMQTVRNLEKDYVYQKKLLNLEGERNKNLQQLLVNANNILVLQKDRYARFSAFYKSRRLINVKQQQVKDELAYQEKQNYWLNELNQLYTKISVVNEAKDSVQYELLERQIFYANENANFSYTASLLARYKDEMHEMRLAVAKNTSINLLNEARSEVQILSGQMDKLANVIRSRVYVLDNRINFLEQESKGDSNEAAYLSSLKSLDMQYKDAANRLDLLNKDVFQFRLMLDKALQTELSSRQGLSLFNSKTILDLGKEVLLVPTLLFQVVKSSMHSMSVAIASMNALEWVLFAFSEIIILTASSFLYRMLTSFTKNNLPDENKISLSWIGLSWLKRCFWDLLLSLNVVAVLLALGVPTSTVTIVIYLSLIWLTSKSLLAIARLSLVETMHNAEGHDIRLYHRLKWMIRTGGVIIALTTFMHLLPMIYELKILFDQLFLFLLMVISLFLLRSWYVVPDLILSHLGEASHPYLRGSVRLLGVLIPLLMFANSLIGLCGFFNLIMTIALYEGIFLLVLMGYLLLRGLFSNLMDQCFKLTIQYSTNGWLLTEAFLKPLDKILRITLFLSAWAVLLLLCGVDKQSPLLDRLNRLLHYKLIHVLNTSITPVNIIWLLIVFSIFYWTAKWTREFVYRLLQSRTKDMGIKNSIAILSQYVVIAIGVFFGLKVLGISFQALAVVAGMFAFGVGLGLRDLANNFASGFLILLERPLRVGDYVQIGGIEGEVTHIGSRAISVMTWDHMELVVPNTEVFNKTFTNLTAKDDIVRIVSILNICRHDNPNEVRLLIHQVLLEQSDILTYPEPHVFLKEMNDSFVSFELRYFVNIRKIYSRATVTSAVLMTLWGEFAKHGIRPPTQQQEIFMRRGSVISNEKKLYDQTNYQVKKIVEGTYERE